MRSLSAGRFATICFFCAVIVQAYPGGHLVRSFIQATSTIPSLDDGSTLTSSSTIHLDDQQSKIQAMTRDSMSSSITTGFPVIPITMTTSARIALQTQLNHQEMSKSDPMISLSSESIYLDVSPDGNDVDYEENDEDSCDEDYEDEHFNSRDVNYGSYSNTLDVIMSKLEEIHSLLEAKQAASPVFKRQLEDTLGQEQAYGNQGKHLTQEQRDSVMSLVKGINGYQASVDGVGNTDQTGKEIWDQGNPVIQSAPLSAVLTPSQIAELKDMLGLTQGQTSSKKPSTSTIGTQAGQTASQAGWLSPGDGHVRDVGYTLGSTANVRELTASAKPAEMKMVIKLEELRRQEQNLMQQIRMMKSAPNYGQSFKTISDDGYHELTPEEQAELTSMLLDGEKVYPSSSASSSRPSMS